MSNNTKPNQIITLSDGDEFRVEGFSTNTPSIKVGTARGYARRYNEDEDAAHRTALKRGHDTAYAMRECAILTADYPGKDEEHRQAADRRATSPILTDGQTVEIEGDKFKVVVMGSQYSDPVHFRPYREEVTEYNDIDSDDLATLELQYAVNSVKW